MNHFKGGYICQHTLCNLFYNRKTNMGSSVLNFNVGVLGHVDSGKTTLAKAMSTVASTASFDKNPQSKERGITLDLGFSSFCVDTPVHLNADGNKYDKLQFTLVDCPGHASLIRTIIGGAQIIDLMMLIVDVTKGMQTQTAECLVIGQICCQNMIVILNKIDLLPESKQQVAIEKMTKKMQKTLENTCFAGCPIIPVSALPGGSEGTERQSIGVDKLMDTLVTLSYVPKRNAEGDFIYAVDHCFSIKGQGTIMTGTILSGSVSVNDSVEIPSMKVNKKIKSIQMFRKPVTKAIQGDRVGMCVTQFDPKDLERGLVCSPGALPTIDAAIIDLNKIPYYKGTISTKAKYHISLMHETVMAKISIFGYYGEDNDVMKKDVFNFDVDYLYQEEFIMGSKEPGTDDIKLPKKQFALLEFEHPVTCSNACLVIGSKLDTDIHANMCRIAFNGKLLVAMSDAKYQSTILPKLRVYKDKSKEGVVERKADEYSVVCKGLFKKETKMDTFVGLKVTLSTGENGVIESSFGQSGKFKVRIPEGLAPETLEMLSAKTGKKSKSKTEDASAAQDSRPTDSIKLVLKFKRYMYDPKKQMWQT